MTTFPPPAATKLAATISGQTSKLALHTQQITTLQTQTASLQTTSSSNSSVGTANTASITTLQGQVPTNLAFLETLSVQHPAGKAGASGLSYTPPTGNPTGAELVAYMSNTSSFPFQGIIDYINGLATYLNYLYDALQTAGIID